MKNEAEDERRSRMEKKTKKEQERKWERRRSKKKEADKSYLCTHNIHINNMIKKNVTSSRRPERPKPSRYGHPKYIANTVETRTTKVNE